MADKVKKAAVLAVFEGHSDWLASADILKLCPEHVPERTLRRWLSAWVEQGKLERKGNAGGSRYRLLQKTKSQFGFLEGLAESRQTALLAQIRDLWTHHSTAVEGNTLSLGDTHFLLEEGLTISGKPLKDHQEVIGHAKAIELIYAQINRAVDENYLFNLHKAVQTEHVSDIYKPYGAWKLEPNGTYVIADNKQVYIEYAAPLHVPSLMKEWINELNQFQLEAVAPSHAHIVYAKLHAGFAHVHPFWDGNGRIARLLANLPLLSAGLPPIVIPNEQRRDYIQLLSQYQLETGLITKASGVWPKIDALKPFEDFVLGCYRATQELVARAHEGHRE